MNVPQHDDANQNIPPRTPSYRMVGQVSQRLSARSFRSLSVTDSSSSLDATKIANRMSLSNLEKLICVTVPERIGTHSGSSDGFRGLAKRCSEKDAELLIVADWLLDVLNDTSSRTLSAGTLADIHCFIGLIREWNCEYHSSQKAFIYATWISKGAKRKEHVAVSLFLLGQSYGRTGQKEEMRSTIQRASEIYFGDDHELREALPGRARVPQVDRVKHT
jgi:hypothetical protein